MKFTKVNLIEHQNEFTMSIACRSGDGKCHPIGTSWTEKKKNTCLEYECWKEQLGFLSKMIQQSKLSVLV